VDVHVGCIVRSGVDQQHRYSEFCRTRHSTHSLTHSTPLIHSLSAMTSHYDKASEAFRAFIDECSSAEEFNGETPVSRASMLSSFKQSSGGGGKFSCFSLSSLFLSSLSLSLAVVCFCCSTVTFYLSLKPPLPHTLFSVPPASPPSVRPPAAIIILPPRDSRSRFFFPRPPARPQNP
jgi:hypothetical protein